MTTSGVYSFSVSRDDIIRQSMLNIRRLDADENPTATESYDCQRVLNMLCKQWMGKSDFAPGLKVWTRKRGVMLLSNAYVYTIGVGSSGWTNAPLALITKLSIAAAAASTAITPAGVVGAAAGYDIAVQLDSGVMFYTTILSVVSGVVNLNVALPTSAALNNSVFVYVTAAQNPRKLESVILRDQYSSDTPLTIMQAATYDALPNKTDPLNTGDPTAVYYEEDIFTSRIYLDVGLPQDIGKYLVLTYMEPVQDFVNPTDTPYYPQEWYLALCWGLSEQICPMFGSPWTDKMESLKLNALAIARNHGAEVVDMYFQPGIE